MKLYRYSFFISISLLVTLAGCQKKNGCDTNLFSMPAVDSIQQVICRADTTQSYAVYLPHHFDRSERWPVILCFDSHGDGSMPLKLLRPMAEKLGYILAGSNNSENGIGNIEYVVKTFYEDVMRRYPVDQKRIYTLGFSGGGRVASSMAVSWSTIHGVVTCGAGIPQVKPSGIGHSFEIAALAGDGDFNYEEVQAIPDQFEGSGFKTYTRIFHGKHAWPSREELWYAMLWLHLNAMREGLVPNDRELTGCINMSIRDSVKNSRARADYPAVVDFCRQGIALLYGHTSVKWFSKELKKALKDPAYKKYKQDKERTLQMESNLKQGYQMAFNSRDTAWWSREVTIIHQQLKESSNPVEVAMYNRLLAFLSIMAYSYTNRSIQAADLESARRYVTIYGIVDPGNEDYIAFRTMLFPSGKDNATKPGTDSQKPVQRDRH